MTVTTQLADATEEPTDPAARVRTSSLEWAVDTRSTSRFRWLPLGIHKPAAVPWNELRRMFPDAVLVLPDPPLSPVGRTIPARRTDPATSHAATLTPIKARTQRAKLLESFGLLSAAEGITDEEAMEKATGVSPLSEYAKRCSELREAGLIEPTGATRKGGNGKDRIVSKITEEGHRVLSQL